MKRAVTTIILLLAAAVCFGQRVYLHRAAMSCEDIYAEETVDDNGDPVLTFYFQIGTYRDSVFLVVRQDELTEFSAYISELQQKREEWIQIARANRIKEGFSRKMPVRSTWKKVRWTTEERDKYDWGTRHETHDSAGECSLYPYFRFMPPDGRIDFHLYAREEGAEKAYNNDHVFLFNSGLNHLRRWANENRLIRAYRKNRPMSASEIDRLFK